MTYSPSHVTPAQTVEALVAALTRDLANVRRLAELCDAVDGMRGRRPPADPDNIGRRGSVGPGRPTEDIALDDARLLVIYELTTAVQHITKAAAYAKGTAAALDRALSLWEGEPVAEGDESASAGHPEDHRVEGDVPHGADGDGGGSAVSRVGGGETGHPGGGSRSGLAVAG